MSEHASQCMYVFVFVGHSLWHVKTNPIVFPFSLVLRNSFQKIIINISEAAFKILAGVKIYLKWNWENRGGLMASNGWIFGQIEREGNGWYHFWWEVPNKHGQQKVPSWRPILLKRTQNNVKFKWNLEERQTEVIEVTSTKWIKSKSKLSPTSC